jgi:hypothetical protein
VLTSTGDVFMWLSDDDRKIMLRLQAKVKIGNVILRLIQFKPGDRPVAMKKDEND